MTNCIVFIFFLSTLYLNICNVDLYPISKFATNDWIKNTPTNFVWVFDPVTLHYLLRPWYMPFPTTPNAREQFDGVNPKSRVFNLYMAQSMSSPPGFQETQQVLPQTGITEQDINYKLLERAIAHETYVKALNLAPEISAYASFRPELSFSMPLIDPLLSVGFKVAPVVGTGIKWAPNVGTFIRVPNLSDFNREFNRFSTTN